MKYPEFNFKNPKTILYISILLVVIFFIAKYAIKQFQKTTNDKLLDNVENDIKNNDLSYADSEYSIMADQLETAMRGVGTDITLMKTVLNRLKTKSDWLKLVSVFGTRPYGNWFYTHEGTLINWIEDEYFKDSTKAELNGILSKINVQI